MSAWVHCPECGHRLFFNKGGKFFIEIKCSSCKKILTIDERVCNNETHDNPASSSRFGHKFPDDRSSTRRG